MHKIPGLMLAIALLGLAGCSTSTPPALTDISSPVVVVKVDSISCVSCCNTIKEEIAALPGVKSVEADPETKLVQIQVADAKFDSKIVLDRLSEIKFAECKIVKDVKN